MTRPVFDGALEVGIIQRHHLIVHRLGYLLAWNARPKAVVGAGVLSDRGFGENPFDVALDPCANCQSAGLGIPGFLDDG